MLLDNWIGSVTVQKKSVDKNDAIYHILDYSIFMKGKTWKLEIGRRKQMVLKGQKEKRDVLILLP